MSPESQRIAIAEACGWKSRPDQYYIDGLAWFNPVTCQHLATCDLPYYLSDLNAMFEVLRGSSYLWVIDGEPSSFNCSIYILKGSKGSCPVILATASGNDLCQVLAEAFLKAKGLWTENER